MFASASRSTLWIAFFATILAAWWAMFDMARMAGVDWAGRPVTMNMMPMDGIGALALMWAIMMAAMMLPTMLPTLRTYDDLILSATGTCVGWAGVLLGYFIVWVGFAGVIAVVQGGLMRLGLIDLLGAATSLWLAAALLIGVGAYQFSRLKATCHGVCHSPMGYFLGQWRPGFAGGARMGLGLGIYCVGCCWGFMALGFAGGVMSLLWMGLATVFMVFEKLPQVGHHLLKPAGAALVAGGLYLAAMAGGFLG